MSNKNFDFNVYELFLIGISLCVFLFFIANLTKNYLIYVILLIALIVYIISLFRYIILKSSVKPNKTKERQPNLNTPLHKESKTVSNNNQSCSNNKCKVIKFKK